MFRFFKLYSLYMNNTDFSASPESCVCEKLPRAVLHVPVNRFNACELCGLIRRPRTCSSDEEEKLDAERQKILLQRRHAEEAAHMPKAARFKVAVKGKKPQVKSNSRRIKSDNWTRTEGGGLGEAGDGDGPTEASKMGGRRDQEPSAPPPSSPSPAPSGSPCEDMSSSYTRRRLIYDDQFMKKFIPLKGPITDPSGGAISKRSGTIWGASSPHIIRQQGPLSKDKLQGGGLSLSKSKGKYSESQLASQFPPFDEYEGPSEDAFVADSARRMLSRPNSLYMEPRPDLPNNRINSHGASFGRIWLASHTIPTPPAPRIPEPPSVPCTNKSLLSEEIKADTKGSNKSGNTSSSPVYQLTKSEEHPGTSECEEILQSLGLIELSNEEGGSTFNQLANEDVVTSNKTMTDEEYSEIISKEWGVPSGESIVIGLKASDDKISFAEKSLSVNINEKRYPSKRSRDGKTTKKLELAKFPSVECTSRKERVCPVSRGKYFTKASEISNAIAPRKPVEFVHLFTALTKNQQPAKKLLTRKLDTFERVQHMCGDLPMPQAYHVRQLMDQLSVSFVQREPAKYLTSTCDQCRRPFRYQTANSNPRKISRDRELEPLKVKLGTNRVCPVHSDNPKRLLCKHKIIIGRLNKLETKRVVGKMEKLKMLPFTRSIKTFYKVYHMSVDLLKPQFVSYVRHLSGILSESYVQTQPFLSFIEFRVSDKELSGLKTKKKARAVWPSMRPTGVYEHKKKRLSQKEVFKRVTYAQNFSQSYSLKTNFLKETELEMRSQEQNQKRPRNPVPEPENNQDAESERKLIKAVVKYFRSIKKPAKNRGIGIGIPSKNK